MAAEIQPNHPFITPTGQMVFDTQEHETVPVPLSLVLNDARMDLYPEVTGKDYFKIYSRGDQLVFQAGGFVGQIAVNSRVAINIRPRADIGRNLERILLISEHAPVAIKNQSREYAIYDIPNPTLVDLLTQSLLESLQQIAAEGLHREYRLTREETSFPRGRILIGETMRRHLAHGVCHEVTASWHQQTIDTPVNRCLKYALWYLASRYKSAERQRRGVGKLLYDLNRAYRLFDGVELDMQRRFLSAPLVIDPMRLPSIRAYYRNAINLATTIIRDRGITLNGERADIVMPSLVIDMEKVFESYLRTVLRTHLSNYSGQMAVLDGTTSGPGGARKLLFDEAPSSDAEPDIVIQDTTSGDAEKSIPIVMDAKYKPIRRLPDRADINQVIAYAASYRSPTVIIAHPSMPGTFHGFRRFGQIGKLQLHQYGFNLGAENLEEEEQAFAAAIGELLR